MHTAHDVVLVNENKINILYNRLVYKFSDVLIVHSETNKKQLSDYYKISKNKIYVMPHGSFNYYKDIKKIDIQFEKEKLDIEPDQTVLLFFGFIKYYKGLELLLEALNSISDTRITLIVAGEFENEIIRERTLVRINNLPSNIKVIGKFGFVPPEKIPVYFAVSDLVVLPYLTISHSGVLHLAYSFSKPVLATDVGDFSESIEIGRSGLLVKQNDPHSLSAAIKDIANGMYDLKSMGEYARKLNDQKYSWEISAKKLKEVYESIYK
jgi:D-inositol-3-phosphate glycosyltransferase